MQSDPFPPGIPPLGTPPPESGLPAGLVPSPEPGLSSPRERVWGFWPTIGLGFAVFAVYAIAQVVVAIVFIIAYTLKSLSANPELDILSAIKDLATNGLMISLATFVSAIAGGLMIWLFVKIRRGLRLRDYLALQPFSLRSLIGIVIVFAVLLAASTGLDRVVPQSPNTTFMVDMYRSAGWLPLLWLSTVVLAPLFEEAFFRGFIFAGLSRSALGPGWSILLTAAVFALLHALQYDFLGVATVFILGLVLGVIRHRSGSLWASILFHAAWNLSGMIGTALYISGGG